MLWNLAPSSRLLLAAALVSLLGPPAGVWAQPHRGATNGAPPPLARSADDLLVLEVRLDGYVLATDLFGYLHATGTLLPLGELMDVLGLAITVEPDSGLAQGWFLAENRRCSLDLVRREVVAEGRARRFEPGLAKLHDGDLFVDAALLSAWLPIDFEVDLAALRLMVAPREKLPRQLKLERRERWQGLEGDSASRTAGPRFALQERPYQMLDWPVLDGSSSLSLTRDAEGRVQSSGRYSVLARGDLLGMTGELFFSGAASDRRAEPLSEARLVLSRRDPERRLLGFLRAGEVRFGDLSSAGDRLIGGGSQGLGLEVSRRARQRTRDFDRTTLRGDALPGWDVELYRNNVLSDVLTVGGDGRYEFRDVPLQVGLNVLRLVFYGPHGHTRERLERFFISSALLPPGESAYRFGLYRHGIGLLGSRTSGAPDAEALNGELSFAAELERGISRWLSLRTGLTSRPAVNGRRHYASLGLETSLFGGAGRLRTVLDAGGGWAGELAFQRRLARFSLAAEHLQLVDFRAARESAADRRSDSQLRLEGQVRVPGLGTLPVALTARWQQAPAGGRLQLRATSSYSRPLDRLQLANRLGFGFDGGGLAADGRLLLNGRLKGLKLRGQVSYSLAPEPDLAGLDLTGDLEPRPGLGATFGLSHSLADGGSSALIAGVDWRREVFNLGINAGVTSDGSVRAGASLSFSLGREPRAGRWRMRAGGGSGQGAVSARVFLDRDGDGRFGDGDQPLEGVRFEVDGARQAAATGADGVADLRLPCYRHVDLAVAEGTLGDPYWVPRVEGLGFIPRPGVTWTADFPVVSTGEIDGTVFLRRGEAKKELSNVRLQLVGAGGEVVREAKSQFDGFYLFDRVPAGRYLLRVDPEQAKRRRLRAPERQIELASDQVVSGVDLAVELRTDSELG